MPSKKDTPQSLPQKPSLNSPFPLLGKPWQRRFPTPRIQDYVVSVRMDTRTAGFVMPKKGDVFNGTDQQRRLSPVYTFATAVPVEQLPDHVDLYYIAPFANQEDYNFTVEYPYVDKDYPRFTRTYFALRTDSIATDEPQADTFDPRFGRPFQLTDHKIERFTDDPVFDAVFVRVMRVFERLPSPIITSYEANPQQQVVTVQVQEVMRSAPPAQSALTEAAKQERTGTAKAKNTLATVPEVFPNTGLTAEIPSMTRELWLGGFEETQTSQDSAGQVSQPTITPGNYQTNETQLTKFKKRIVVRSLPLPQTRIHQQLTREFGGGLANEQIDIAASGLVTDQGEFVISSELRNLTGFGQIKKTVSVTDWPILYGSETDPKYGIIIQMRKQVVPAGTIFPPGVNVGVDEHFVDIKEADKWRSIQIVSKVDPNSLPADVSWDVVEHLEIPPIITALGPNFQQSQTSEASGDLHGVSTGVDNTGHMTLTDHTRSKDRSTISRAFGTASGLNRMSVGSSFELATTKPFLGYIPAVVTRHISFGPAPLGSLFLPGDILRTSPVTGVATLVERMFEERETDGCDQNHISATTELKMRTITFGPVLVGGPNPYVGGSFATTDKAPTSEMIISDGTRQNTYQYFQDPITGNVTLILRHYFTNLTPISASASTYASQLFGGIRQFQIDSGKVTGSSVVSEVRLTLPPSSPVTFITGNRLVVKIEVEVWRLNIYVTYITTVRIP